MGITVFKNGSLARERVRDQFGLTWPEFSRALQRTPPGNRGRMLLPWYEPEITPDVPTPGVHTFGLTPDDGPGYVRAVVEAQQMALALHSRWMGVTIGTIHATGGAAANRDILQVMADVFGADVYQFDVGNSACLGAALRAYHADAADEGRPVAWDDVVKELAEPVAATRVRPDPARRATYDELMQVYAERERGQTPYRTPSSRSMTS
jgi:xylulokinase